MMRPWILLDATLICVLDLESSGSSSVISLLPKPRLLLADPSRGYFRISCFFWLWRRSGLVPCPSCFLWLWRRSGLVPCPSCPSFPIAFLMLVSSFNMVLSCICALLPEPILSLSMLLTYSSWSMVISWV